MLMHVTPQFISFLFSLVLVHDYYYLLVMFRRQPPQDVQYTLGSFACLYDSGG